MNKNIYCVIMAGGVGSRFWPISRMSRPKQFLDILGTGKTFIRQTYDRFARDIPAENFLVVTNSWHKDIVLEQLPALKAEQVLCEPLGRNTAPCIAYAAFRLAKNDPDATMIVTPADHLIIDTDTFMEVAMSGVEFAQKGEYLCTIGVMPTRPATGYGYIQVEMPLRKDDINKVKTFTEKPGRELAQTFVDSGEFFWNSGIFIWSVKSIMNAVREFQPDIYTLFESINDYYGTDKEQEQINIIYPECRSISIDYGVMEKANNVYVRCGDFGWSDIGTWNSLYRYSDKDENGNVNEAEAILENTKECMLRLSKDKLTVIEGLHNYIVVDTDDVLMICPREKEQSIKNIVEEIKLSKGDKYL